MARVEGDGAPVRLGTSLKKEILRTTRQAHARIQMALGASTPLPEVVRRLPVAPWNEARRAALVAELLDLGRQIEACERRVASAAAELDALPVENRMIRL